MAHWLPHINVTLRFCSTTSRHCLGAFQHKFPFCFVFSTNSFYRCRWESSDVTARLQPMISVFPMNSLTHSRIKSTVGCDTYSPVCSYRVIAVIFPSSEWHRAIKHCLSPRPAFLKWPHLSGVDAQHKHKRKKRTKKPRHSLPFLKTRTWSYLMECSPSRSSALNLHQKTRRVPPDLITCIRSPNPPRQRFKGEFRISGVDVPQTVPSLSLFLFFISFRLPGLFFHSPSASFLAKQKHGERNQKCVSIILCRLVSHWHAENSTQAWALMRAEAYCHATESPNQPGGRFGMMKRVRYGWRLIYSWWMGAKKRFHHCQENESQEIMT